LKQKILSLLTLFVMAGLFVTAGCSQPEQSMIVAPSIPSVPPPTTSQGLSGGAAVTPPAESTPMIVPIVPSVPPPLVTNPIETPKPSTSPSPTPLPSATPATPAIKQPEETSAFPVTVTDDLGRKVTIDKLPQRIISLAPSNTEILFALGLDDSIVGVTQYCNYPEAAKTKTKVAGYSNPSLDRIVSLKPDLIVAESIHEKMVLPALENLRLKTIVTSADSLDTVFKDIIMLGQATGRSKNAAQLVERMTQRMQAVTAKTSSIAQSAIPKVFYVIWNDPLWTMGGETFVDDVIKKAGGINIFSLDFTKSRTVSVEVVIARNPDVILVSSMGTSQGFLYGAIKADHRLDKVSAMVNGRVYEVDSDLIERPGPRIIDGLEQVARMLHPELFTLPANKP